MAGNQDLLFLRDLADVEPPRERYKVYDLEDIYKLVPKPQWTGLEDEIWTPRASEDDPQLEKVKQLIKRNSSQAAGVAPVPGVAVQEPESANFASKGLQRKRNTPSASIHLLLNSKWTEMVLAVFTIWALFAEDSRIIALDRPESDKGDVAFWTVSFIAALLFFIELMLRSFVQRGYLFSFFFWLDIVAVGSMVLDFLPLFQSGGDFAAEDASSAARAGRAARAGTKVGRLLRLLRIVRVLKLFLASRKRKQENLVDVKEYTPSELGKELKNRISKKSILFVLFLLVGEAFLDFFLSLVPEDITSRISLAQVFVASNETYTCYTKLLDEVNGTSPCGPLIPGLTPTESFASATPFVEMRQLMERQFTRYYAFLGHRNILLQMKIFDLVFIYPTDPYSTQWCGGPEEASTVTRPDEAPPGVGMPCPDGPAFPFDTEWLNCTAYNFMETSLAMQYCPEDIYRIRKNELIPSVIAGAPYTSVDPGFPASGAIAEVWLTRRPFVMCEAIFSILFTLCVCFLLGLMGFLFARDADQMVIRPIENMVDKVTKLAANPAYKLEAVKQVKFETDALYVSLAKIAGLLQVGFGEAGNNLIAENLKKGDSVDPMVPGKKLLGAYGFCIIDDYEEVLECLGEEILPFTNTAAVIVHEAVTGNGGQPNRNLGDAFLCVWKPKLETQEPSSAELQMAETKMCDGALTAYRTCVRKVQSSSKLQAYNSHEEISKYFDGQYSTVIGYGLHYGWAIEGAVGTNIKIDCSYLSPNVNLAARLESATKMYGVNILMSQYFVDKLSVPVRAGLRRVDVVCLKGSSIPMAIYTCDRSNALYASRAAVERLGKERVIETFQQIFEEAMDAFVKGDWPAAKSGFEQSLEICPHDKPCRRILWHMDTPESRPDFGLASTPFVAPEGWPGYHILLSK